MSSASSGFTSLNFKRNDGFIGLVVIPNLLLPLTFVLDVSPCSVIFQPTIRTKICNHFDFQLWSHFFKKNFCKLSICSEKRLTIRGRWYRLTEGVVLENLAFGFRKNKEYLMFVIPTPRIADFLHSRSIVWFAPLLLC